MPFLGSSTVEHAAVNRRVVGSSPTSGAKFPKENGQLGRGLDKVITEATQQGQASCHHVLREELNNKLRHDLQERVREPPQRIAHHNSQQSTST